MSKTALSFLSKGYQVIPLSRKTGTPVTRFKDIPVTEEFIKNLNWENCDIALLMRGVWCIDIDTHSLDAELAKQIKNMIKIFGADLLSVLKTANSNNLGLDGYSSILNHEYKEEILNNFKNTYLEQTASGGLHVLFRKQDGIDYSQHNGLLNGVDIKANDNNYVKIFPSIGREVLQAVKELPIYDGKLEKEIFSPPKQRIVTNYFTGYLPKSTKGHLGKEAYERIVTGTSLNRNDDLFKAACWAFENNQNVGDLYAIVGTIKGNDVFTLEEWERTIESARKKVNFVSWN
ncbi:bifunctional DNA primase/polymerase [Lactococcus garvieae]|uniref:Bifunctional DNA primase/polymerase, N-terminal n=1 Tax=Lactococcus garvieae TaxID=1363 RepID=A0A1I4I621_9LACT|nr:bifunctional DNA primase/polymerase [Lactococcus garvieae]SFL49724.1 Bifunctional DNA primase/polymerase, N-terminal [Lactococcus garvieae]